MRQKLKDYKGATLVEFALILPLLFMLVFGVCEYGWAMYVSNSINNAAREGARLAAVTPKPVTHKDVVEKRVKETLSTINYATEDLMVEVAGVAIGEGVDPSSGDAVKVTVTLQFHSFTRLFPGLVDRPLRGEATMRYE